MSKDIISSWGDWWRLERLAGHDPGALPYPPDIAQKMLSTVERVRKTYPPANYLCQVSVTEDGHDHDPSGRDDPTPTRPCRKPGVFVTIVYDKNQEECPQVCCLAHRDAIAAWLHEEDRRVWGIDGPVFYEELIPKDGDEA
jgi:hypothetical protein